MSDSKLAEQSRKLAACQRVMGLIDTYVERPNAGNRLSIREALLELAAHEAEQQAGEAVAWVDERAIAWLDGRSRTATITTKLQAGKSLERPMPLFTHPQQPLTGEQITVLKFLYGSGLLRGVGYGGLPDGERRPFWWRKQLGDAFPQIRAHGITKDTK